MSLDECVLRLLLGASPTTTPVEADVSEPITPSKLTTKPADGSRDDNNDIKQQAKSQQHQKQRSPDLPATSQATLRRTRRHTSTEHASTLPETPGTVSPPIKHAKYTTSKEKLEPAASGELFSASVASLPLSGRRDSVEAAVAALIGEPYEETPAQPVTVTFSKSTKGGNALRGDAEKTSTAASISRTAAPPPATATKSP
ncbi:hypothetical protein BIW11_10952, partial [Tropilaelaps mercedesae]